MLYPVKSTAAGIAANVAANAVAEERRRVPSFAQYPAYERAARAEVEAALARSGYAAPLAIRVWVYGPAEADGYADLPAGGGTVWFRLCECDGERVIYLRKGAAQK